MCITLISFSGICGQDLMQKASEKLIPTSQKIFLNSIDEKKNARLNLEHEKKDLESQQKEDEELFAAETKEIDAIAKRVKLELKQSPGDTVLEKTLTIVTELYQVLKNFKTVRVQIIDLIDEHMQLITNYLNDPEFGKFKKEHKIKDYRVYYSFNDLQYLHKVILDQEYRLSQLNEQEKNANTELGHRKQSVTAAAQAYKQKLEEREKALKESSEAGPVNGVRTQHLIELLNLEERLYKSRQQLDELRLQEIEHKVDLIATKKFIVQEQLPILKEELRRIKPSIRATEADISAARNALTQKQQQQVRLQETYRQQISTLDAEKDEKEKALNTLSKRYNVPLGPEIDEWRFQPSNLVASYVGFCQVGALNAYIRLIAMRKKLLDVQNALNEAKINDLAIQVQVKESFSRKFATTEAITQEIQKYDKPKADAQANLSLYKTKVNEIDEQLNDQRKILDAINALRANVQAQQTKLFGSMPKEYAVCLETLSRGENVIKERIELIKKLGSIDAEIITTYEEVLRQINFIIAELNSMRSSWRRPEYAISWDGIKNIIPETEAFFSDVAEYIRQFNFRAFITGTYETVTQSSHPLLFIAKLCLLLLLLVSLKSYLSVIVQFLLRRSKELNGLASMMSLFLASILGFVDQYFVAIAVWLVLCAFLMFQVVLDPYFYIIFYLFSIPYLLFIANRFINYMINFNAENDYVILSKEFQRRFMIVFSVLLYATITIVFFREAFMLFILLANYYRSELPNVLLAINFIIFQIALIFLISKEQILGLIQKKGAFWQWIREQVDRYYVLLLILAIAVIIMSNPYVGFGRLVLYVLRGVLYTSLLMMLLVWLYGLSKRMASHVFFAREEEVVRERFSHAKTWFGLLIIGLFVVIGFLGIFVVARIWEWQLTFDDLVPFFTTSLLPGVKSPITVLSILQLIAFVMAGFLVSYAINRFVLDKIFDLLLIDMGVQHTVTSIGRYIIVGIAIFFGFHMVGLGELVIYVLGALALGVGWILKEPISDFVAYFIILVQRPVKIGDYIRIDENTLGVVRQITPRAVVLRRKNSITIIVPNSYVVSHSLINWNYVRKFIAFDDIIITIHYTDDPYLVKKLLHEVVESHPKILKNPKPVVRLDDFGEYGYKFMVRGYLSDIYTLDQWEIASDVRLAIVQRLRKENIGIAIPVLSYMGHKDKIHTPKINDFEHRAADE
jgi:small-conductance mechanosensitive channel